MVGTGHDGEFVLLATEGLDLLFGSFRAIDAGGVVVLTSKRPDWDVDFVLKLVEVLRRILLLEGIRIGVFSGAGRWTTSSPDLEIP